MKRLLRSAAYFLDDAVATASLGLGREPSALIALLFHGLFENRAEAENGLVNPYQPLTVQDFRRFVTYFLECGYRFVSPADILRGLEPGGRYVHLTFDDGYANNLRAQPILREFKVPATFFVSVNHVAQGKAFWWDALYRARRRQGAGGAIIQTEQEGLKRRSHQDIDAHLADAFGGGALRPVGETDRPMTEAELKAFAMEPHVTIGNHTADHAILTLYDDAEAREQIRKGQQYLRDLTGHAPIIIAYPNGNYDHRVVEIARSEGLNLGAIVDGRTNRLPLDDSSAMTLSRTMVGSGRTLFRECRGCRASVHLLPVLRRMPNWLR